MPCNRSPARDAARPTPGFDLAVWWAGLARDARAPSAARRLRLVQIATLGALAAALSAEVGVAYVVSGDTSALRLLAPRAGTLHPFLPTFIGVLALPVVLAGVFIALARVYRVPASPFAALAVAIYGAVPLYVAMLFLATPFAGLAIVCGVLASLVAWRAGCRRVLGVGARESAQFIGITLLAALVVAPMLGALLATLA